MIRDKVTSHKRHINDRIIWRSHEVSRIEAFSDAIFAFAVTLLIISLEVPKDIEEMLANMKGFIPFAICFTLIFQIWYTQNIFFRRYGLNDTYTIVLNGMLLFFVLFFVYPLKFLFTHMTSSFSHEQAQHLFYIYSGGFVAIYMLFALMYINALRIKDFMELSESEVFETRTAIYSKLIMAGVGAVSVLLAFVGGKMLPFAGIIYMLIGPAMSVYYSKRDKKHKRLYEQKKEEEVKPGATAKK